MPFAAWQPPARWVVGCWEPRTKRDAAEAFGQQLPALGVPRLRSPVNRRPIFQEMVGPGRLKLVEIMRDRFCQHFKSTSSPKWVQRRILGSSEPSMPEISCATWFPSRIRRYARSHDLTTSGWTSLWTCVFFSYQILPLVQMIDPVTSWCWLHGFKALNTGESSVFFSSCNFFTCCLKWSCFNVWGVALFSLRHLKWEGWRSNFRIFWERGGPAWHPGVKPSQAQQRLVIVW